jgi:DNA primase
MPVQYNIYSFLEDTCGIVEVTGDKLKASCPFHMDKTPSLYFYGDGSYYCYSCQTGGQDVVHFVNRLYDLDGPANPETDDEYIDYLEALDILYPYVVGGEPGFDTWEQRVVLQQDRQQRLNDNKQKFFVDIKKAEQWLAGNYNNYQGYISDLTHAVLSQPLHYLLQRSFRLETLQHFKVHIWEAEKQHPIWIPLLFGSKLYGYMNRTTWKHVKPKYLTMPGTPTNEYLYGNLECEYLGGVVLVTEGVTDVWMAWQRGQKFSYAILGSTVSEAQARILNDQASAVIAGFDNDIAGVKATQSLRFWLPDMPIVNLMYGSKDIGSSTRANFIAGLKLAYKDLGRSYPF